MTEQVGTLSKRDLVKEALATGLTSPKDIAAWVKERGVEITPAHVGTLKNGIKNGAAPKRRGRPASNGERNGAITEVHLGLVEMTPKGEGCKADCRLSVDEVAQLIGIIKRTGVGPVQQLVAAIG